MKKGYLVILIVLTFFSCIPQNQWKYLGQEPPGFKATIFAPGVISGIERLHTFPAISPDGKTILWMKLPPKIYQVVKTEDSWSEPEIFPPLEKYSCLRPSFSADGNRVYFSSAGINEGKGSLDIWFIEKTEAGYGEPQNIGSPVNSAQMETCQSFASNGNIYFTGLVEGKRWNRGLLFSACKNGEYSVPEILPFPINIIDTSAIDYLSYVASDESFLLFASNRQNMQKEDCRIYVSFKEEENKWGEPINVNEEIGFDSDSRDPYLSPDQKYLFFSSGENIYWVDARVIGNLKKKE